MKGKRLEPRIKYRLWEIASAEDNLFGKNLVVLGEIEAMEKMADSFWKADRNYHARLTTDEVNRKYSQFRKYDCHVSESHTLGGEERGAQMDKLYDEACRENEEHHGRKMFNRRLERRRWRELCGL